MLDNAKRRKVVIEATVVGAHQFVELVFAGVPEGWVANVVNQCERFRKGGVQAQSGCNGAGNLRYFDGVRQTIAKMIGKSGGENLRLGFQPPKGARMNDAIAITNVFAAVGMRGLAIAAAARVLDFHSPRRS